MIEKLKIKVNEKNMIVSPTFSEIVEKVNDLINQREMDKANRDSDVEKLEEKIAVLNKEVQNLKKRLGII